MRNLPIGVIDSGYGGLTVVKELLRQLPNESIIYLGDSARAPYGPQSSEDVRKYIHQLTHFLLNQGIKMLVIACNTGTAAALETIRSQVSIPVVGVIHAGARAAIKMTHSGRIGVIGTEGTIKSEMYAKVMRNKNMDLELFSIACPEFVTIVEDNAMEEPSTFQVIEQRLQPFKEAQVDTLVLGCTHYPHLYDQIQEVMGEDTTLIDSGVETINEVSMVLDYFNISKTTHDALDHPATLRIYTTGNAEQFTHFSRVWLQDSTIEVKPCHIKGDIICEDYYCEP